MLVRCEHCGSALPQEYSKCFRCGEKRTPQIYSRTEIEIPDPTLPRRRRRWLRAYNAIWCLLFIGIVLLIVGAILVETSSGTDSNGYFYYRRNQFIIGEVMVGSFSVCAITSFILHIITKRSVSSLQVKTRVIEKNKIELPKKAEYEQRIRDFVNHR